VDLSWAYDRRGKQEWMILKNELRTKKERSVVDSSLKRNREVVLMEI